MELKSILTMIRRESIKRIVVTGPRMSGTKIGAYILAKKLNSLFLSDDVFGFDDFDGFMKSVAIEKEFICQCPELAQCIQKIPEDILVVVMNRPLGDILLDQRKWGYDEKAHNRYYQEQKIYDMNKPLAHVQYEHLEYVISKRRRIEYLDFESLGAEKIFLSVANRRKLSLGRIFIKGQTPKKADFRKAKK